MRIAAQPSLTCADILTAFRGCMAPLRDFEYLFARPIDRSGQSVLVPPGAPLVDAVISAADSIAFRLHPRDPLGNILAGNAMAS
jgi:hypothetical protein